MKSFIRWLYSIFIGCLIGYALIDFILWLNPRTNGFWVSVPVDMVGNVLAHPYVSCYAWEGSDKNPMNLTQESHYNAFILCSIPLTQ